MSRIPLLLCLLGAPALAAGPQWSFESSQRVKPGALAEISLRPANTVRAVQLTLSPVKGGGVEQRFSTRTIKEGARKVFRFRVPRGLSTWRGTLTGSAEGATTTATLELQVVSAAPLDVRLAKADVDLAAGQVVVRPTNPLKQAEVQVWDADGDRLLDGLAELTVEGPRTRLRFEVPPDANVRRVELKLTDAYGFWATLRVVRWYDEVAHDRVEFESARWDVRPAEVPKLDGAIAALSEAVRRFRAELGDTAARVDGALYVAGYTDTVGSAADNRALSERRARSIARYFKSHGISVPIWYAGFGEGAQAVPTTDEVPEAANRRALYILASSAPAGPRFPHARWRALR